MTTESTLNCFKMCLDERDQRIPFVSDGVHMTFALPGTYAAGDTVTLNVTTSYGTATASGTIPASGASANAVAVSGAKNGSIFYIAH